MYRPYSAWSNGGQGLFHLSALLRGKILSTSGDFATSASVRNWELGLRASHTSSASSSGRREFVCCSSIRSGITTGSTTAAPADLNSPTAWLNAAITFL